MSWITRTCRRTRAATTCACCTSSRWPARSARARAFALLARRPLALRAAAAWARGLAVVVAAGLALAAAAGVLRAPRATETAALWRFGASLAAASVCLAALGRAPRPAATALVLVVAVAELAYLRGYNVILPPDQAYPPRPPAVAALQAHAGGGRVSVLRPGPFEALLQPDTPALYELEGIQGYDYPQPLRWADFSWHVLRERGPNREIILTSPPPRGAALTGLRMMNTRLYIGPPGARAPSPELRTVYAGRDGTVFEDPGALPRAYVVAQVRRLGDAAALAAARARWARPAARGDRAARRPGGGACVRRVPAGAGPSGSTRSIGASPSRRAAAAGSSSPTPTGRSGARASTGVRPSSIPPTTPRSGCRCRPEREWSS